MKVTNFDAERAHVELSFQDVYVILQCLTEAHDRLGGDVPTIVGIGVEELDRFAAGFCDLKEAMRTSKSSAGHHPS
ncbi:MAG: hypothetical protein WAK66_16560 [Methylocystis sp.]